MMNRYPKCARISMNTTLEHAEKNWALFSDDHFQDYDEFAQSIRGWGVDFRQLNPGQSLSSLQQFGMPGLMVTRFNLSQAYEQRGSTPNGMLTIGFLEEGAGKANTPNGAINEDNLWCFSAGREFGCTSQMNFRAYGISISEVLLDEVADTCQLSDIHSKLGSNQIVRCKHRTDLDELRQQLASISNSFSNSCSSQAILQANQHDLVRELLEALDSTKVAIPLKMSVRKRQVLSRTLDYLEANPGSPITVHQLAKIAGAGVRTLEYVFRDYFGVTPKTYLMARRLAGARHDLLRFDTTSNLVHDVAIRWGFWHLGRFSTYYKNFYGELPSETLKRQFL